jgi:hypothetical protein
MNDVTRVLSASEVERAFDLELLAVVSVDAEPPGLVEGALSAADLEAVREWIRLNRAAILAHWREETDGVELGRALKPLA